MDLRKVLKNWRERIFRQLHVSAPGYIVTYDPETRLADVQLTVKIEINQEFQDPPLLKNVPVRQYNNQSALFYLPPAKDDLVDVIFTDYSIAEYHREDGQKLIQPGDTQKHGINNAYAVLRVETVKNKRTIDDPTLPGIYLADDSKLFLGRLGGGKEEVMNLIHQTTAVLEELVDYITTDINFTGNLGLPTGPPTTAPLLAPLSQKLVEIKIDLESLGDIEEI